MNDENKASTEELQIVNEEEGDLSEEGDMPEVRKKLRQLKENLKKCDTERRENLAGWQRAKADHINYKNEEGRRMEDMARFITAGLIQEVLPVLDSFDLALQSFASQNLGGAERGILLIRSQFEDILRKRGLEQIKTEPGEKFDPEKHETVGEVEAELPEGTIAEEVQRGYWLRERLLRPARVRLSKNK